MTVGVGFGEGTDDGWELNDEEGDGATDGAVNIDGDADCAIGGANEEKADAVTVGIGVGLGEVTDDGWELTDEEGEGAMDGAVNIDGEGGVCNWRCR